MDQSESGDIVFQKLKYATAVAVLRAKPADADAYLFTKQLCAKYLQAQSRWRARYLQAQATVLHLKQQQAIYSAQSEVPDLEPHSKSTELSIVQTPPSSASMEANEALVGPYNEASDQAGSSSSGMPILTVSRQQSLLSSYHFIHTVVSLAEESSMLLPASTTQNPAVGEPRPQARPSSQLVHRLDTLLTDTVPSCVGHLREVVSSGQAQVSTLCILRGLDGLLMLLDAPWMESLSGGGELSCLLLKQLSHLIDDLLDCLFEVRSCSPVYQSVQTRSLLHQMLQRLTTGLRVPEKLSLLHSIAGHAKSLCAALTRTHTVLSPDLGSMVMVPDCYEALGTALDCLHTGMASVTVDDIHADSLREVQEELESVLTSALMNRFPLVARAVLRLTSHMEQCYRSEV